MRQQLAQSGVTHSAPEPTMIGCQPATAPACNGMIHNDSATVRTPVAEAAWEPSCSPVGPELRGIDLVSARTVTKVDALRAASGMTRVPALPQGCGPSGYRLVDAAQRKKLKSKHCCLGGKNSKVLATMLAETEAKQRWNLHHDTPRYCQFMEMRQLWYRLLQAQAVRLQHHVTTDEVATAATHLVKQWIQDIQQTYGTLLPADEGITPSRQATVQPHKLLDSSPSVVATTAIGHTSQPIIAARNADPASLAEVTSADQQGDADEPCPSSSADAGRFLVPPLGEKQSVGSCHWQPRSPLSDCCCRSCLAWQTGKQPLPSYVPRRQNRPYLNLPVGTPQMYMLPVLTNKPGHSAHQSVQLTVCLHDQELVCLAYLLPQAV